ncbi:RnfH family protein [Halomonas sp. LR5S13]|uniref:RnfH family protein n=1 Tax=Halomonas rhizosphaerae TaxID=3043296 RepID=UPI0024A9C5F8|nr:RnfH family protein [Halomonas rhizosphaerae]MDI5920275.1 RnfH family protein [Halomonas rhizosphaerae]
MVASTPAMLDVEVAFALPERQRIISIAVPEGSTARQAVAVAMARLEEAFPELPPTTFREADLGIFGKRLRDPDAVRLRAGDRVEVYRPLQLDPKAARSARAAHEKR